MSNDPTDLPSIDPAALVGVTGRNPCQQFLKRHGLILRATKHLMIIHTDQEEALRRGCSTGVTACRPLQ